MMHRLGSKKLAYQQGIARRAAALTSAVTRRSFLSKFSAGALALSLPVWRNLEAQAQTIPVPKRFFGIFTPNGTVTDQFFPAQGPHGTLPAILQPLDAFKSQFMTLKGVQMDSTIGDSKPGGPHMKGPGAMLTGGWLLEGSFTGAGGPAGYANRVSVDQYLAQQLGQDSAFPSLEFGVDIQGQEPLRVISYRGPNQPNPAIDDPWVMFDRVFANLTPDNTNRDQLLAERRSVLDYVSGELTTLETQLPADDRPRLEAHLSGIRSVEHQLDNLNRVCMAPTVGTKVDPYAKENYPAIGQLQMDLMFQAHVCDLTRISTFMWSNADSWQYFPWIGVDEEHHALSHLIDDASQAKLVTINTWYSQQMAYLLTKLDGVPEGDSTLLNNSVVLWGNEIGVGDTHTHQNIPWLLAGTAGGYFSTGRSIDFGGQPHNNLLLSVLHAFGLESETTFGAPENCTGPLVGLTA